MPTGTHLFLANIYKLYATRKRWVLSVVYESHDATKNS